MMPTSSSRGNLRGRIASASWLVSLVGSLLIATVASRPAAAQDRVFWGDVHGHTSHSDGKGRPLVTVPDPGAPLPAESKEQQATRHAKVAKARAGTIVIVHRGAWQYAPENTLSAICAAFELGANGVELDFRRTKDGVIVLFHDDRLERLLDGLGSVEGSYYEELLLCTPTALPALAAHEERVPTLRDVLRLVRDRAGLLHLDIKMPGIDDELLAELRSADMLDHVVTYNDYNSEAFRRAGIPKLQFKGGMMGRDTDSRAVEQLLARPGTMVILDDPRATLSHLGKSPVRVVPESLSPLGVREAPALAVPESVLRGEARQMPVRLAAVRLAIHAPERFVQLAQPLGQSPDAEVRRAVAWNLGMVAKHRPALLTEAARETLLRLLRDKDVSVRAEAALACGRARIPAAVPAIVAALDARPSDLDQWTAGEPRLEQKRVLIESRARYAFALGLLGLKDANVLRVLCDAVKHRGVHRELWLVGMDGAMAARALGKLHATEAVGVLREALHRNDPTLAELSRLYASSTQSDRSPSWWDFQLRTFLLPTLAEIGNADARAVLEAVLSCPPEQDPALPPGLQALAAEALASFRSAQATTLLAGILSHRSPEVRQAAILTCLKSPQPEYRKILEAGAAWAVPWWDCQHRRADE